MKNAIRTIISLIRANPEYARVAITLDACVGLIFGAIAYVVMNATDVAVTNITVLALATAIALLAIGIAGYTYLYKTGYDFADTDHDYEEDE